MFEAAGRADARRGSHVHAMWLQDHNDDEVSFQLVATQQTIGEGAKMPICLEVFGTGFFK